MAVRHTEVPDDPRVKLLLQAYAQAQATILRQLRQAIQTGDLRSVAERRRLLADVTATLTRLGIETDAEAAKAVENMFDAGIKRATATLPGPEISVVSSISFNQVNRDALQALQESILSRLQDARRTIGRQVNDVFAREQRAATVQALLGAEGSPRAASRALERRLRQRGVTAFIDKAGKRWSLENYTEMAVRTVTREAVVAGAVNTIAVAGIDLVQVTFHASACPVCQPFEGQIMSLTGFTGDVDGVQVQQLVLPPFHPRCTHSIAGYTPSLAAVAPTLAPL